MKIVKSNAALLSLAFLLSACSLPPAIDLGQVAAAASETPRILAMRYLGQSSKTSQILIFEVDFDDADGDLAPGSMTVFVNRNEVVASKLQLRTVFLQNELDPASTTGTLRFPVAILIDEAYLSSQKASFAVGIQMVDGAGNKSNLAQANLTISK